MENGAVHTRAAPFLFFVTTVCLKQRQWSVSHAARRAKCRQCSRQNTDNELQNRLPSLSFHRLKIKFIFWGHGWPRNTRNFLIKIKG